ncbi:helix-turn-helix transcriptional regulator [Paraeggerthella hongkongensis]|uniref:Helix-turn-helix transcriptional regulator n=1 Tax=Paraeggerthella hongkongensis TaxID=230658 RepID=A0A3N0AZ82_9ACTN|nr:LuxR family transcriptional regulator [Paraeggerthella hongkongensis]RNL39874.1 helix-turn-helix transcriptional regulator [Paraeggerthella hongkongensis]
MGLVLFHVTLIVLLASILASATCLSAYLVSRKRLMLFSFFAFLFYFFDVAFIFQDEFVSYVLGSEQGQIYLVIRSLSSVVTGGGFLVSFWLLVCDYLGETRRALLVTPGIAFVALSVIILAVLPESDLQRFLFYGMRELFVFWMLLFTGFRYFSSKDEVERSRLWKHRWLYVAVAILNVPVLLEDMTFFMILNQPSVQLGPFTFSAERNYAEEALLMCCAFFAGRDACRVLSLRFERPPMRGDQRQDEQITENLMVYAKRHQLSEREREVLHLVLLGKDNQNIASTMHVALSTVKVHVHNILQKTGRTNRQDLIQDFWKTS